MREGDKAKASLSFFLLPSCVFRDETFPSKQGSHHHKLPSELAAVCGPSVRAVCINVHFSVPFSPPSSPTQGPQYNNRTAVVKSIKVRVLYFHYCSEGAGVLLVVLCKPASWSSLLVPPLPHLHCRVLDLLF